MITVIESRNHDIVDYSIYSHGFYITIFFMAKNHLFDIINKCSFLTP